ncbi:unnamed protein product, partial [Durusdinium trenchii]
MSPFWNVEIGAHEAQIRTALDCCKRWIHADREARRATHLRPQPSRVLCPSTLMEVIVVHDEERSQVRCQRVTRELRWNCCGIRQILSVWCQRLWGRASPGPRLPLAELEGIRSLERLWAVLGPMAWNQLPQHLKIDDTCWQ